MDGQNWPSWAVIRSLRAHRASTSGENTESFVFHWKAHNSCWWWPDFWLQKWSDAMQNLLLNHFLLYFLILYRTCACSEMLWFLESGAQGWLFVARHSLQSSKFCDVYGGSLFMHSSTGLVIDFSTIFMNHRFSPVKWPFVDDPLVFTSTWRPLNCLCWAPLSLTK